MTTSSALVEVHRRPGAAPAPRLPRLPRGSAIVVGVSALTLAALLFTGEPILALLPALLGTMVWRVVHRPLRGPLLLLFALAILGDIVPRYADSVSAATYYPITALFQYLLLENLNKITGIAALRFSGFEVVLLGFGLLATVRQLSADRTDAGPLVGSSAVLRGCLALAFATVLWLEVRGVLRGGADIRQSLWQMRALLWMPLIASLCIFALRAQRDFRALLMVLTATAAAKIVVGLYFYWFIALGTTGLKPATATSHADTVLFVVVLAVWLSIVVERVSAGRVLAAGAVCSWMFLGLVINNRRTAFVSLAAVLIVLFFLQPRARQRPLLRLLVWCSPILIGYLALSTRRTTGVFAPGASLMSAISQKDASSATRDIENYNLLQTLKPNKVLGTGWGHEYRELVVAYDISQAFAQYRFVAHNSVLWLWGIGGLVGFTGLWLHLGVGVYLATRSYRLARSDTERVAAYGALAVTTAYLIQAWADMGTQSWTATTMLGCAHAVTARLAVSTGAVPVRVPVFARRLPRPAMLTRRA